MKRFFSSSCFFLLGSFINKIPATAATAAAEVKKMRHAFYKNERSFLPCPRADVILHVCHMPYPVSFEYIFIKMNQIDFAPPIHDSDMTSREDEQRE